ncbi:hypothetical protein GCM10027578_22160 [Spirosoma luteolum]
MFSTNDYLAAYGIAESSLSDSAKDGIKEVLRAAGKTALEQFGSILQEEARKRGIKITDVNGNPVSTPDQQAAAAQAALDAFNQEQEKQKKQRRYLLIGAIAFVVLAVAATFFLTRKR